MQAGGRVGIQIQNLSSDLLCLPGSLCSPITSLAVCHELCILNSYVEALIPSVTCIWI